MPPDFRQLDHLPKVRGDEGADPGRLPRQRRGKTPQMYGRYPDYDCLEQAGHWDELTRKLVVDRVERVPELRFFNDAEATTLAAFSDVVLAQNAEPRIPVLAFVDEKLFEGRLDGYQYAGMPDDRETWRLVARGLDESARSRGAESYAAATIDRQQEIMDAFAEGELLGGVWEQLDCKRAWSVVMRSVLAAFYSHPWAWNEIGFGGPAYPRGYARLGVGLSEAWEGAEALDVDPDADTEAAQARVRRGGNHLFKGSDFPNDNDSAFLLDVHRRGVPGRERMRRFRDDEEVDLLIVGCGAGGAVLAQRLARAGWRIVVLDRGPFWDPDEDWVSDEEGSHHLYWTDERIVGGADPVELGKNNSGHGVGGSMVHYAGYTPRFHPSDFETRTRDGVGFDWPISYWELKSHYERVERELPVAGQDWPWGDRHSYPHGPHPICGAAERAWAAARAHGIEMRVGPVAIINGVFGNRPHCIYRGFCLQGCKVNAKASPLVTHVPDAVEHGVEIRADSMAVRIEVDEASGRVTGLAYVEVKTGRERFQRVAAVAVCGYSIESPRLLLNSTSKRFSHGLGNTHDQVGRYVMVQGATQVAARFPELLRMYKAPPPEVSSEDFYETDASRGFARGFSIQTVSPLPVGWAEHVLADGHRGAALREYMRDYNHWAVLGSLCELLPLPENRVTLANENDQFGMPVARFDYSQCDNDRANIAFAKKTMHAIWETAGAQDVLTIDRYAHLVGGCRMGSDAETSVIDADHRVWEIPNLFVCDGSVMPTQGSANPALTIMALASRLAERLSAKRVETSRSRSLRTNRRTRNAAGT